MRFSVFGGTTLAAMLAFTSNASANAAGLPGYTGKPTAVNPAGQVCQSCHNSGTAPAVAFMGPATLTAGQVAQYSLVVTTGSPRASAAIAATDGITLAPITGTRETFGELVPDKNMVVLTSGGKATFTFTVKAPPTGTAIKLWASGMGSNNNKNSGGDGVMQATMNIAITGGSTDAGADSGSDAGTETDAGEDSGSGSSSSGSSGASSSSSGSSGTSSGGAEDDGGSTSSSSGSATLPSDEAGGCNVSGNGGYGSALLFGALGMIPLLARRRRAKT